MIQQPPSGESVPSPVIEIALENWRRNEKNSSFTVTGESMKPFLLPGDTVFISHSYQGARPGQLFAFLQNKTLVVHRLLQVVRDQDTPLFLLKGDNRVRPDPPVKPGSVVGRVSSIRRGGKEISLETPAWRFVSLFIANFGKLSCKLDQRPGRVPRFLEGLLCRQALNRVRPIALALLRTPGKFLSQILWKLS